MKKSFRFTAKQTQTLQSMLRLHGIKQRAVAEKIGVSESMFSKIVSGSAPCLWDNQEWEAIAGMLGVSCSTLLFSLGLDGNTDENLLENTSTFSLCFCSFDSVDGKISQTDAEPMGMPRFVLGGGHTPPCSSESCLAMLCNTDACAPDVSKGDMIVVDRTVHEVKDEGFFVLEMDGQFLVRYASPSIQGQTSFVSNDPARYPSFIQGPQMRTHIFGRIIAVIKKL